MRTIDSNLIAVAALLLTLLVFAVVGLIVEVLSLGRRVSKLEKSIPHIHVGAPGTHVALASGAFIAASGKASLLDKPPGGDVIYNSNATLTQTGPWTSSE